MKKPWKSNLDRLLCTAVAFRFETLGSLFRVDIMSVDAGAPFHYTVAGEAMPQGEATELRLHELVNTLSLIHISEPTRP